MEIGDCRHFFFKWARGLENVPVLLFFGSAQVIKLESNVVPM